MDKIIYEYSVIRFVPDLERGEFVNVGLLMLSKRYRWMRSEIKIDEQRIKSLFKTADISRLKTQLAIYTDSNVPRADIAVEEKYRWLAAVKSAIIQTSPSHPGIILMDGNNVEIMLNEKFNALFEKLIP